MGRTESFSIQVHPNDEQAQINLMQRFGWNLLSSQEIKVMDSHLERRGDTIQSVTKSEHYIKLVFSREVDMPNLDRIKRLESEYFSFSYPGKKGFVGAIIILIISIICFAGVEGIAGVAAGVLFLALFAFLVYITVKKNKELQELANSNARRQQEILKEVDQLFA